MAIPIIIQSTPVLCDICFVADRLYTPSAYTCNKQVTCHKEKSVLETASQANIIHVYFPPQEHNAQTQTYGIQKPSYKKIAAISLVLLIT